VDEPVRLQRARERTNDHRGRTVSGQSVAAAALAHARSCAAAEVASAQQCGGSAVNDSIRRSLPSLVLMALLVAAWWIVVRTSQSAIFPTPWQVVTGTAELVRNGTLWDHIGASLMRVGAGFGLAVAIGIPLGLWMGWVRA